MLSRKSLSLVGVLGLALFAFATKSMAADFGQASTFEEYYFSFSNENEASALFSASPQLDDMDVSVTKVADDLYVVRGISHLVVTIPVPGPIVTIPNPGLVVTIPSAASIFLVNDNKGGVVRILVDRTVALKLESVDLRVTSPRPLPHSPPSDREETPTQLKGIRFLLELICRD